MTSHKVRIVQVFRVEREIVVSVEAADLQAGIDMKSECNAPDFNNPAGNHLVVGERGGHQRETSVAQELRMRRQSLLAHVIQLNYTARKETVMAATALVQTRVDPEVKDRAAAVLERLGLTVSDVVRILLTRTAHEGALPFELLGDPKSYDVWFRRKVQEALDNEQPSLAHEDVEAEFAARRAATLAKLG